MRSEFNLPSFHRRDTDSQANCDVFQRVGHDIPLLGRVGKGGSVSQGTQIITEKVVVFHLLYVHLVKARMQLRVARAKRARIVTESATLADSPPAFLVFVSFEDSC